MPSGVFKVTDIPDDKVETVIALYKLDNPDKIDKEKQPNNLWTVTATFPGPGQTAERFKG